MFFITKKSPAHKKINKPKEKRMTVNFANENTENLLKHAMRLEKNGLTDAANQLCIKCLKTETMADDGEDMIAFLYGEKMYDTINSVRNTLDAIMVARCALEFYNEIRALNPASSSDPSTAWARRDEESSENRFVDFFSWLTRSREEILVSDKDRIAQAIYAVRSISPLKMDNSVAAMYPVAVIKAAVAKEISVYERGITFYGDR